MAIEAKRGCGYRKVGGLYLIAGIRSYPCDRLPCPLHVCPTCGQGVKQARGSTWINPLKLWGKHTRADSSEPMVRAVFGSRAKMCTCINLCPMCNPPEAGLLLWIGKQFYPTPEDFIKEAGELGISKRIKTVPRGFELGKTWMYLAHPEVKFRNPEFPIMDDGEPSPGIISVVRPHKIERIVKQSVYDAANDFLCNGHWPISGELNEDILRAFNDIDRGFDLVPVPDDDPDHN